MTLPRAFRPLFALLLLGLASPAPALADERHREEMAEALGLSAAQVEQMEEIQFQGRTARITMKARLTAARAELKHALSATTLDEAAVARALEAENAAAAELLKSRTDQSLALRKVLTPEQWEKAMALRRERHDRDDLDDDRGDDRDDDRDDGEGWRGEHRDGGDDPGPAPDDGAGGPEAAGAHPDCDDTHCKECDEKAREEKAGQQGRRRVRPAEEPPAEEATEDDVNRWGDD